MNCPVCGSKLKDHTTAKGVLFRICSRWPKCHVSGTPELLERFEQLLTPDPPDAVPLGSFVVQAAQLRIHQSRLKRAKTAEEREAIRKQALEALR